MNHCISKGDMAAFAACVRRPLRISSSIPHSSFLIPHYTDLSLQDKSVSTSSSRTISRGIRPCGGGAAGRGHRDWTGTALAGGAAAGRAAIPLHANHQVPAFVHAQQHLGHLSRAAGVFDRHPPAGARVRHVPRPAALRTEHGYAHAVVPPAIASHPGIQRHAFIIHIHIALPSPRRSQSAGRIFTFRLCYHYATGKRCVPIEFGGGLC